MLIQAAMAGELPTVRDLVAEGADIDFTNTKGVTPLMAAAHWGRSAVVSLLLEHDAAVDVTEQSGGRNALMYSCLSGDPQTTEYILKAGADVNSKDCDGRTALMMAAINGEANVVKPLVKAGADVTVRDALGYTALDLALAHKHRAVVEFLSSGASAERSPTDTTNRHTHTRGIRKSISTHLSGISIEPGHELGETESTHKQGGYGDDD